MHLRLWGAALLAVALSGCSTAALSPPPGGTGEGGRLSIVATAYPLFEASGNIGGSRTHVTNLLPKSALDNAPLTEKQTKALAEADLAVILGRNTQPNVEAVADQRSKPTLRVLDLVKTKPAVPGQPVGGSDVDPNVWLDPANLGRIGAAIEAALAAADEPGTSKYADKRQDYDKAMAGVDRTYTRRLAQCDTRVFLTTVPAYQYLADRYQLKQVSVGESPDAAHLPLSTAARDYKATTVYFPALPGLDDARELRRDFGVKASTLDPVVNQTDQARRGGSSYGMVMKPNLDALTEGLGCKDPAKS